MSEIPREHFYERLKDAPHAARGFFESIAEHFERDNMVRPHYTDTNGGDLRLAIPGEVLGQQRLRNFATMYWQTTNQVVFARTYLTPAKLRLRQTEQCLVRRCLDLHRIQRVGHSATLSISSEEPDHPA